MKRKLLLLASAISVATITGLSYKITRPKTLESRVSIENEEEREELKFDEVKYSPEKWERYVKQKNKKANKEDLEGIEFITFQEYKKRFPNDLFIWSPYTKTDPTNYNLGTGRKSRVYIFDRAFTDDLINNEEDFNYLLEHALHEASIFRNGITYENGRAVNLNDFKVGKEDTGSSIYNIDSLRFVVQMETHKREINSNTPKKEFALELYSKYFFFFVKRGKDLDKGFYKDTIINFAAKWMFEKGIIKFEYIDNKKRYFLSVKYPDKKEHLYLPDEVGKKNK